jgi:hypothetical protein
MNSPEGVEALAAVVAWCLVLGPVTLARETVSMPGLNGLLVMQTGGLAPKPPAPSPPPSASTSALSSVRVQEATCLKPHDKGPPSHILTYG